MLKEGKGLIGLHLCRNYLIYTIAIRTLQVSGIILRRVSGGYSYYVTEAV